MLSNKNKPEKAYGIPSHVWAEEGWQMVDLKPVYSSAKPDLKLDASQIKLLKTVAEFLTEASVALSSRAFLANSAKDLASQISNKFHIG
jgi:hypothetical protein